MPLKAGIPFYLVFHLYIVYKSLKTVRNGEYGERERESVFFKTLTWTGGGKLNINWKWKRNFKTNPYYVVFLAYKAGTVRDFLNNWKPKFL